MSVELKRMFRVKDWSDIYVSEESILIEQFFMNCYPRISCRKYCGKCSMTTKVYIDNNPTVECGCEITEEQYELMKANRKTKLIEKNRHEARLDDGTICIVDMFHGDFVGNTILYIEFETEKEMNDFICPSYLEETGDFISVEDMML